MELQPCLVGKILRIRPLLTEDFESLYAAASDPLIWEQHPDPLRYQKDIFQRYFDSGISSKGCFVIEDLKTGEVIGSSRFYDFSDDKKEIKIGFTFLKRSHWGGIFNSELKQLMLGHAFAFVNTVRFEVGSENHRSRKALENIGATLTHQHEKLDQYGKKLVVVTYSIEKCEFQVVL